MIGQAAGHRDGPDEGSAAWLSRPVILRTLIVGAGAAARALARSLAADADTDAAAAHSPAAHGLHPVAAVDDVGDLAHLIGRHAAEAVVLADPDLPTPRFRELADAAVAAGAVVRYLPWYAAALLREPTAADLRSLDVRALIDGPHPHVASSEVKEIVTGKRVLVTGAGSLLGAEICRQVYAFDPAALFLLDGDDQALHRLRTDVWGDEVPADLSDREETGDLFRRLKPEIVFHATGLRQAPVLERRPSLGVKATILSTDNLVHAATRHGTERFLQISTDADPASMLGASHRVAETVVLGATHTHTTGKKQIKHTRPAKPTKYAAQTVFAAVRIGDVLDTRGSLLTVLADQIRTGGPVTITHPNASRSFATVEEAVALALEAGRMATGGELYTLDLGEPTLITEVVARFTRQYKLPEVPIRYVGAGLSRSGNPAPAPRIPTAHPQIFALPAATDPAEYAHLPERLTKLYSAAAKNRDPKVRQMLAKMGSVRQPSAPRASDA